MSGRFAGKYDVRDREVKLGLETLTATDVATGRRVQIYCLPLSTLQIDLPCPPDFIARRFRSVVTIEGDVLEADVDPETEYAYVVVGAPGSSPDATSAPTSAFAAYRPPAADGTTANAPTVERPALARSDSNPTAVPPEAKGASLPGTAAAGAASNEPFSLTKAFAEVQGADSSPNSAAAQTPAEPGQSHDSLTAMFRAATPAEASPNPEPVRSKAAATGSNPPNPPAAAPPSAAGTSDSGGFSAFFSVRKRSDPPAAPLSSKAAEPPAIAAPSTPAAPGAFTALFRRASAPGSNPETPPATPDLSATPEAKSAAPGAFTALFSGVDPDSSAAAPQTPPQASLTQEPVQKNAPGSFTSLFSKAPIHTPQEPPSEPAIESRPPLGGFSKFFRGQAAAPPQANLGQEPSPSEPVIESRPPSGGFSKLFRGQSAAPPQANLGTTQPAPPSSPVPQADLTPHFDPSTKAVQFGGVTPEFAKPDASAAPPRPAGPSAYTRIVSRSSAPPPTDAGLVGLEGAIPASSALPGMPTNPQAAYQPAPPQRPQYAPPSPAPAPTLPAAAASGGEGKSKTSYLPLIIAFNVLFVLAVVVVLIFVLTKH